MAAGAARTGGAGLDPPEVSFRKSRASDLPLLYRRLNNPHVVWWYGEGNTYPEIQEEYLPRIGEKEPVEPYLSLHRRRPIGYLEAYQISHDEEYATLVGVENAAGLDLFGGEAEYLYRGLGPRILRRFLEEEIFSDPDIEVCVIGPETENTAAIRAYEKAGFRFFKTIQVPGEPKPEHLMKMTREEFEESAGARD